MKTWQNTYQNNHITLMKIHIGPACFYVFAAAAFFGLLFSGLEQEADISLIRALILFMLFLTPAAVHAALAWGGGETKIGIVATAVHGRIRTIIFGLSNRHFDSHMCRFACFTVGRSG